MKIKSIKVAYFSPTGTTERVIKSITKGFNHSNVDIHNITMSTSRLKTLSLDSDDLLIAAVPAYVGRVPALVSEWLRSIKADKTPAVGVVVYGNRDYDDELLELNNILREINCIPLANATFIGEHSFSTKDAPIAVGRPDREDLSLAVEFGKSIYDKLSNLSSIEDLQELCIPGSEPYRGATETWIVDFIGVNNSCNQCGQCITKCPVDAISTDDCGAIDTEKCILCCACIKACPIEARFIKPGLVEDASIRVSTNFSTRREPEIFI